MWAREGLAYIASLDSGAVAEGDRLTFLNRRKPIASGEVVRVVDGELVVAKLTSGSLMRIKKLDRLRILTERPRLGALSVLRVGYPAGRRTNLLLACDRMAVLSPSSLPAYRADVLADGSYRLTRDSDAPMAAPLPDTLLIRFFEEVADQEISLERGELDVAIFWPGELSAQIRGDRRWQGHPFGALRRGLLAAFQDGAISPGDSSLAAVLGDLDLASLNQQMFRGDLAPWGQGAAWSAPPERPTGSPRARYAVDPSLPGQRAIERFLNRGATSPPTREKRPTVHLFFIDAPVNAPESLALGAADYIRKRATSSELRARADTLAVQILRPTAGRETIMSGDLIPCLRELQAVPLFVVRCPVLHGSKLGPWVSALGADALVNFLFCVPERRRP